MKTLALLAAGMIMTSTLHAATLPSSNATTTYHRVTVDGVGVFYREAGPDADHFPWDEHVDPIAALVLAFLDKNSRP